MRGALTQAEFDNAIANLPRRLKPSNVEIAKAVLVDGKKQASIVQETGLSRSAVAAVIRKVKESHNLFGLPPAGWQRIEVCVPASLVPVIRAIEDEAKKTDKS